MAGSLQISWSHGEGRSISSGDEIATLFGDKDAILSLERTILNILGQLSGIATEAKKWSSKIKVIMACENRLGMAWIRRYLWLLSQYEWVNNGFVTGAGDHYLIACIDGFVLGNYVKGPFKERRNDQPIAKLIRSEVTNHPKIGTNSRRRGGGRPSK